jgi:hypothetical protein
MGKTPIPERQPIGDAFVGRVIAWQAKFALCEPDLPLSVDITDVAQGDFTVRYGLRQLGKPHLSIVPGLVAVDYGTMLTGESAWEFLHKRSNLYPRAEVFGFRHDGRDEMMTVKTLDFALTPHVLVYHTAHETHPFAEISALIVPESQAATVAPRLLDYLPRFASIAEWLSSLT